MREEEALTRYCPMTMNRKHQDGHCVASGCMAWRWLPKEASEDWIKAVDSLLLPNSDGYSKAVEIVEKNRARLGLPKGPIEGYCGLAGKPE